jgi:hypothetical protein
MSGLVELVRRHGPRGVLVDTNLLLVRFIGSFDRRLLGRFKRTQPFTSEDYDLLGSFLECFSRVVTTPHVLSEVNSLSGQLGEPARTRYFKEFAGRITTLDERYVASAEAAAAPQFPRLGLTDSGILYVAKSQILVLTDDFQLAGSLQHVGAAVVNFNHLRGLL